VFEEIFEKQNSIDAHRRGPLAAERELYLRHLFRQGAARNSLRTIAPTLVTIARDSNLISRKKVSRKLIEKRVEVWLGHHRKRIRSKSHQRTHLIRTATKWLRFLKKLSAEANSRELKIRKYQPILTSYVHHLQIEKEFAQATITSNRKAAVDFLHWLTGRPLSLECLSADHLDAYVRFKGASWSRRSMAVAIGGLKSFLQYCEMSGLHNGELSRSLIYPRRFRYEDVPSGPSWATVQKLLAQPEPEYPAGVRDRAILLLLAVYGLRASEVVRLRFKDIDWRAGTITVYRSKNRRIQIFPLTNEVGEAISRYLKERRPKSEFREIFLTTAAPIRSLQAANLCNLTRRHYIRAGVVAPHRGPHSLRHACATHLLSQRLSLKEIGDHLGHRSSNSTRVYAKVDLAGLREVAEFDLGGLQ
jgi:site-specific recombinase XerD